MPSSRGFDLMKSNGSASSSAVAGTGEGNVVNMLSWQELGVYSPKAVSAVPGAGDSKYPQDSMYSKYSEHSKYSKYS